MKKLSAQILELAYRSGYFPMAEPKTEEIYWYNPDPRAILPLEKFHVSKSLQKTIRKGIFRVSFNQCFEDVMRKCADRKEGTWISEEFIKAYCDLFDQGKARSVEVWKEDELAGGLYGVCLGKAFFAESKFHIETDASKVALYSLVQKLKEEKFILLEVQFLTEHLEKFGVIEISTREYENLLAKALS